MTARGARWLACASFGITILGASCALPFLGLPVDEGSGGTSGSVSSTSSAPNGTACSSDDECAAGHCVPSNDGSGNNVCCMSDCTDQGVESCSTNGKCDAAGSGCALYPSGSYCGPITCDSGFLTGNQCAKGACGAGVPIPCAGGLKCDTALACKTSCMNNTDCRVQNTTCEPTFKTFCMGLADGSVCDNGDECASKKCGTKPGPGHCCKGPCDDIPGPCGPTDCDTNGDCVLPDDSVPCGTGSMCTGNVLTSDYCDHMGGCTSGQVAKPCGDNLSCADGETCNVKCGMNDAPSDNNCAPGYFCNGQSCQARYPAPWLCQRDGQCASGRCDLIVCSI